MCSEYTVRAHEEDLENALKIKLQFKTKDSQWDTRIKFTRSAPVICQNENDIVLADLIFPANPFPNARLSQLKSNKTNLKEDEEIVRIYDVPMWKSGFNQDPCLIPLTSFYEPAYWGQEAGQVMEFSDPRHKVLFVPGFLIKPRVPATGKLNGFTMLTHTAPEQMWQYHQRMLMLLEPEQALEYLKLESPEPEERFQYLIEHRYIPKFQVAKDRTMAKGWERRVDQHLQAKEAEQAYRNSLLHEQVPG